MALHIVLVYLILIPSILHSQSNVVVVNYREYLDLDSPIPLDRESTLIVTSEESLYYTARDSMSLLKGMDWKGNLLSGIHISVSSSSKDIVKDDLLFRTYSVDKFGSCVHISRRSGVMTVRALDVLPIIYEESVPKINWEIKQDSSKTIGDYSCSYATALFRGRQYNVWFTLDLPLNSGPWKLNGLPGLIIEASETKGKRRFIAENITIGAQVDEPIDISDWTGKRMTHEKAKTFSLEHGMKNWIRNTALNFDSSTSLEMSLNANINNLLEIYPEEQLRIINKYKPHLKVN